MRAADALQLVVTTSGVPLGLAAVKFWGRKGFKGTNAREQAINPTTVPIEEKESYRWLQNLPQATRQLGDPGRCVHVGDREADVFELLHAADLSQTHVLVRTAVDRLAGRGGTTVARVMRRQHVGDEAATTRVRERSGHPGGKRG